MPAAATVAVIAVVLGASLVSGLAGGRRAAGSGGSSSPATSTGQARSATRVLGTVSVGNRPFGVAADPITGAIYVSNTFGNGAASNRGTVSVIDSATRKVTATVPCKVPRSAWQ